MKHPAEINRVKVYTPVDALLFMIPILAFTFSLGVALGFYLH